MSADAAISAVRGAIAIETPADRDLWRVAADTWCLRMPVDLPIRHTHCYFVIGGDDVLVVDPGWDVPGGIARIIDALTTLGRGVEQIVGIVATHAHRDHVGLAHALAERAGPACWVAMHQAELEDHAGAETFVAWRAREQVWMDALGVPAEECAEALIPDEGVDSILHTTRADRALGDGEPVRVGDRTLTVLHTPGHSPGSLCLLDRGSRLIFTGDTLLPRISPNVGWAPHGRPDPLGDYLDSLDRLTGFADWTALPGHEWPFSGVDSRAAFLRAHHAERAEEILAILDERDTAWSLAERLTWSRGWAALSGFQRRIAAAETAAHLRRLLLEGSVSMIGPRHYAPARGTSGC